MANRIIGRGVFIDPLTKGLSTRIAVCTVTSVNKNTFLERHELFRAECDWKGEAQSQLAALPYVVVGRFCLGDISELILHLRIEESGLVLSYRPDESKTRLIRRSTSFTHCNGRE